MKKLSMMLLALLLIILLPAAALAEETAQPTATPPAESQPTATPPAATPPTTTSPATTPPVTTPPVITPPADPDPTPTPATGITNFEIDNIHIFDGMDRAYQNGYKPTVKDGKATVVLPLLSNGRILGNVIKVTPGLGDPSSSPFVYNNYQTTVARQQNPVAGEGTVPSYLIRFDFPLASGRNNGVYPVTIDVQAQAADGSPVQQTFTIYITITDGKDPNATAPVPGPEKPTSEPKVIVSNYEIDPSPILAGGEFTAKITLRNTSETKSVQNMTVTASCDSPSLLLKNDSNTFYISKLGKGAETSIELHYKSSLETVPQLYNIMLAIQYDNSKATVLSSSGTIPFMICQPLRVEMEAPLMPQAVNAGDTFPLAIQVMNMGRSKALNVRCELSAPGLLPSSTAFIGNMEAGTAMTGDINVFVGTKDMSEGYTGTDKYGLTNGKITLVYEDENGQEYTQETEFATRINEPVLPETSSEPEDEPEKAGQWWISITIGTAVIAGLAYFLVARAKKEKKHEDF